MSALGSHHSGSMARAMLINCLPCQCFSSDPDGKEPPGQRQVPSPGQSALCLSQGKTGWSNHITEAEPGATLASRPPGCQAEASAACTSAHTSARHRFWLSLTGMHAQQSQPCSSLLVCVAQSSPVLPHPTHPSHHFTVLPPGIVCKVDEAVDRLLGIPSSGLMQPDWENAFAALSPGSQRDRCHVD